MRYTLIILSLLLSFATEVSAQRVRIGERIPDIEVQSEYGPKLEYIENDYTCLVFINSHSAPCIEALKHINSDMLYDTDIVLVTKEKPENHSEIVKRLGTDQYTIAYDVEGKTYRSFGVNYVPFSVIYSTKRKRVESFGSVEYLCNGSYCE
ncbi:MAG: redoxin domain-containing protein [Alistipes sp.]|nr:redoxin domain-containing protein [Alistipes sp.]